MASDLATIPINFNLPGSFAEFDSSRAQRGLAGLPHHILLIGQKTEAGTAQAGKPVLVSQGQASGLFGRKSHLRHMADAALAANPYQEIYALPLADPSAGTATTHIIKISGTATLAGSLEMTVAGRRVSIGVSAKDTAQTICSALKTALDSNADLPIGSTAKSVASAKQVLTLTHAHKGLVGNNMAISLIAGVSGIVIELEAGVAGAGVPANIVAGLGDDWWTEIVNPFADDVTQNELVVEAIARDGGTIQKPVIIYSARAGSVTSLSTYGADRNSRFETTLAVKEAVTPIDIIATVYAATTAQSAAQSPARPVQYMALAGVSVSENFTDAERNLLVGKGLSTLAVTAGGTAQIERAVTTYTENQAGAPDKAYRDVEDMNNLFYLRFTLNQRLLTYYARSRIGHDTDLPRPGVVRPKDIRAAIVGLAQEWVNEGLVTDIEAFKAGLSVERDANESDRILIRLSPELIGQLRQFFTQIQFRI